MVCLGSGWRWLGLAKVFFLVGKLLSLSSECLSGIYPSRYTLLFKANSSFIFYF